MTAKFFTYDNVTTSFDRGYTLYEHYDDFGLINMNKRRIGFSKFLLKFLFHKNSSILNFYSYICSVKD